METVTYTTRKGIFKYTKTEWEEEYIKLGVNKFATKVGVSDPTINNSRLKFGIPTLSGKAAYS